MLVVRVGARAGVRARRGRSRGRRLRGSNCSSRSTRRWPPASSPTFPAAAVVFASPTSSSATRSTRGSRPPAAFGCTGWRPRRSKRSTATSPDRTWPSLRTTRSPEATSTRASVTPGVPATGRSRCSRTRRPHGCTGRRSRPSTSRALRRRERAASFFSRSARLRSRAGNTPAAKKAFVDAAGSRDASACP